MLIEVIAGLLQVNLVSDEFWLTLRKLIEASAQFNSFNAVKSSIPVKSVMLELLGESI